MTSVKKGSKYFRLHDHLRRRTEAVVELTFPEIEALIGAKLPSSAYSGRAFWSNRGSGALQAAAWMAAGYRTSTVDLKSRRVTFRRPTHPYLIRREGETIVWDADLVRALRAHMGMNQAGLAEVLGVRQQTVSEWETGAYAPTRARSKHLTMAAERAGFKFSEKEEDKRPQP